MGGRSFLLRVVSPAFLPAPRTSARALALTLALTPALTSVRPVEAEDWPQWRGPRRDGKSTETGLLRSWPAGGPRVVWKADGAGTGYSTVSVSDGRVFTMGNRGRDEYIAALSLKDGKELWSVRNGRAYRNSRGSGPRGTPTVDGKRLYALGANGDLSCLEVESARRVWHVNILERFGSRNINWGLAESPLIEENLVITSPGGDDACVVALDKETGETVWTSKGLSDEAGYASAVALTVGGVRQIVHFTDESAVGVRADDGAFLWRYRKASNGTANCATPVVHENFVFVTSGYGQGCALLELSTRDGKTESRPRYFNKVMQNHHGNVVLVDGHIYGYSRRGLVCMDFLTGTEKWRHRGPGKCSVVYADGHLYCLSENGVMALVEADSGRYVEKSRFVFKEYRRFKTGGIRDDDEKPTWAHPVVSNGRLFLRDEDRIFCYDIAASGTASGE